MSKIFKDHNFSIIHWEITRLQFFKLMNSLKHPSAQSLLSLQDHPLIFPGLKLQCHESCSPISGLWISRSNSRLTLSKSHCWLPQVRRRATGLTLPHLYWANDPSRQLTKLPRMIQSHAIAASLSVSNSTASALRTGKCVGQLVRVWAATIKMDLRVYDRRLEIWYFKEIQRPSSRN
jgi:hypothetical protein